MYDSNDLKQRVLDYLADEGQQTDFQVGVALDQSTQDISNVLELLCQEREVTKKPLPDRFKQYPGFFDEQGNPKIFLYEIKRKNCPVNTPEDKGWRFLNIF